MGLPRPPGSPIGLHWRDGPPEGKGCGRPDSHLTYPCVSLRNEAGGGDLPHPPTSFVGRSEELRRLGRIVVDGRLVTLHGPAGAGKTRLSLEAAARTAERFPDGVHFADLAGLHEPELVPSAVAAAAGVRERPGREALAALTNGIRSRRALLILDNCEHLLDACRQVVQALLEACPTVAVLATSREPLGLPAETVFPVPPMGVPPGDADPAAALRTYDATRLFLTRAERAVPGLAMSPSDARVVARICRRLDGLPLAIELAASRLKVLSAVEIDERLADRFRLLQRVTGDDVPLRQRTLRAAIHWSYALLEEPERRLLQRLSVFAGGFGLDVVEDVCAGDGVGEEEILDLVAGLVDKSLVVRGEHAGRARHRLLDSIRDFAAERCAEHEDLDRLRSRHFDHFLAVATRADDELRGPDQAEWLTRMDADEDNFRAALRWGMSAGDPTATLDLVWLLHHFWMFRGNFSESRKWFDEAMARAADAPPSVNRARAFTRWGEIAEIIGEYEVARSRHEQSLAVGRAIGDSVRIGTALLGLGEVALVQGDLPRARLLLEDSLIEYRKAGDRERARWPVTAMASLAAAEGDLAQAAKLLELSLSEARALGNDSGIAASRLDLSRVAHAQGDLVAARSLCEEGLGLARRLGVHALEGHGLVGLSHLELDLGQAERALDAARSALRLHDETGGRLGVVVALEAVAAAEVAAERLRAGVRLYGAAAAFRERLGTPALRPESTRHSKQHELARAALGEQRFAGEWGRGRALSWEEATTLALGAAADAGPGAPEEQGPTAPSMVLEGEVWTLRYQGQAVRLRDSRGLRFIAMLLADPGREFHVLDLMAPAGGRLVVSDSGAAIDPAARDAYRRRVEELRRVIDEAQGGGDQEQEAQAREELGFIGRELAAAYGLTGTARRLDDPAERARKAVSNRIRDAVARVEANQPALGRHLRASIRTGTFCSYQPERAVAWEVRPGQAPGGG
jgi:predicted ATPase